MSTHLERADDAWESMSVAERIEALDTGEDNLLAFLAWLSPNSYPGSLTYPSVKEWLRQHPRFAAWLDREAERQRTLAEEPDDWNDDNHPNND